MLHQHTLDKLHTLRLTDMAAAFEQQLAQPATQRNDLTEVIENRYRLRATLNAGQLPIGHWHEYIGEATLADAILDPLLHNAHRLPPRNSCSRSPLFFLLVCATRPMARVKRKLSRSLS